MTIEEQIRRTKVAVDAVLQNARLQEAMATYGYRQEKMLAGKACYEKVLLLNSAQQKEYGESYEATDTLRIARTEARELYMHHLNTARFALKMERGYWKTLQLAGKRKKDLFGWLEQAQIFYANIGEVIDTITKYNVTEAELEQGQAMVEAVFSAYETRRKEFSEACLSTRKRDAALQEMNHWMGKFARIAEIALEEEPELLALLGLSKRVSF